MPDSWCIYHVSNCTHVIPKPKDKYIAIVCVDPYCVGFFINTEIHSFFLNKPELSQCHVKILMSNYKFLTRNSYIDCNEAYPFRKTELRYYVEPINTATKAKILKATRASKMLEAHYQRVILGNS